jgi:hypothetical protein
MRSVRSTQEIDKRSRPEHRIGSECLEDEDHQMPTLSARQRRGDPDASQG